MRTWVLLLNVHHIACDGWSIEILEREIGDALCSAFLAGKPADATCSSGSVNMSTTWPGSMRHVDDATYGRVQGRLLEGRRSKAPLRCTVCRWTGLVHRSRRTRAARYAARMTASWLRTRHRHSARSVGRPCSCICMRRWRRCLGIYSNERDIVVGFPVAGRRTPRSRRNRRSLRQYAPAAFTRLEDDLSFSDLLDA
jgi:hypothetical protein